MILGVFVCQGKLESYPSLKNLIGPYERSLEAARLGLECYAIEEDEAELADEIFALNCFKSISTPSSFGLTKIFLDIAESVAQP